jgi:hypothetical protein
MAREIQIISSSTGTHYLLFGMNDNEISSFAIQLWIEKHGQRVVDFVQAMGLGFISFMGGDVWVHNSQTANRCNLFGEKRDCIIGVVSNEQPNRIKLYDALGIHSNDEWEITDITIPASLNYPNGMISKIPKERFKKRDGVLRAEFLRNMKTTSNMASVMDALNGEVLRGYECVMTLKNTSNGQVRLFKVDVGQTLSKV